MQQGRAESTESIKCPESQQQRLEAGQDPVPAVRPPARVLNVKEQKRDHVVPEGGLIKKKENTNMFNMMDQ